MADPADNKGQHAREFTNHELLTLRVWFDLDAAGNDELAQRFLDAGLMLEHYTSLLDNDPNVRTLSELVNQAALSFALQQVLDEANTFLRAHGTEMKRWVDAYKAALKYQDEQRKQRVSELGGTIPDYA